MGIDGIRKGPLGLWKTEFGLGRLVAKSHLIIDTQLLQRPEFFVLKLFSFLSKLGNFLFSSFLHYFRLG